MAIKDLFSRGQGRKMSEKGFTKNFNRDSRLKEFFGNKNISKILDKSNEKHEFYGLMSGAKEGGLTKKEMKEKVFGELMAGKGRTIDRKEAYALAKEVFADEKVRYILPVERKNSNSTRQGMTSSEKAQAEKSRPIPSGIMTGALQSKNIVADLKYKGHSDGKKNKEAIQQSSSFHQKEEGNGSIVDKFEKAQKKAIKKESIFSTDPERHIEETASGETYFDSMKRISRLTGSGKQEEELKK